MTWFKCIGSNGGSGGEITPLDLSNEVHNIQANRSLTIINNEIISPITSGLSCVGIIAVPFDTSDDSNIVVIKYDLQGYSQSDNTYYSTSFFDDNNTVNSVTQKSGSYPYTYKQLYQANIASGGNDDLGHIDCLGIPTNISGPLYLKINFGTTNYKSLKLYKTKV